MTENISAFLAMIRKCEGTSGENGYLTLFGGGLFDDFSAHPNRRIPFTQTDGKHNFSTAAGAYQFLFSTWTRLQKKLGLPDFSPASQDAAAIELLAEAGAIPAIKSGDLQTAIYKCSPIWASLPASKYYQPKRSLEYAQSAYQQAGGIVA